MTQPRRPHVALLVETSLASGRDILRGITRYVREHDPWSLYIEPRGLETDLPGWLEHWKGDGIIARVQSPAMAARIRATGIPAVDVLGEVPGTGMPLVHVDDPRIAALATQHLRDRGFRSLAFVGMEGRTWSDARREAFCTLARSQRPEPRVFEFPAQRLAWEDLEDRLAGWITALPKPVGVMLASDQLGPAFLEACRRAGVVAPGEVAVIGVDDDAPLCEVCDPPLSSVQAGHERVGYAAAELLGAWMNGRPPRGRPRWIEPEGVTTRLSTEVLAIADHQVAQALRLIREHATVGIDVDTIARQVGLSRSVLQRRFRQHLDHTVHDEILAARTRRACQLLAETDLPIAEIALRCGFNHQEYLGHVLRARLQTTPLRYRKQHRRAPSN